MNINRNNYEEFFLLYVDKELTAEQRKSVEQFLQENPDLVGELELFRQTSLVSDDSVVFEGKESLMKQETEPRVNLTNYEEWLVAYIDQELSPAARIEFEKFVSLHPAVKEELAVFQQTKLQPEPGLVFVHKEILYRKEEKVRVITLQWWKIAVAAVLILAIGFSTLSVLTRNNNTPIEVADAGKKNPAGKEPAATTNTAKKEAPVLPAPVENTNEVAIAEKTAEKTKTSPVQKIEQDKIKRNRVVPETAVPANSVAKTTAPLKNNEPVITGIAPETKINSNPITDKKESAALNGAVAVNTKTANENINSLPVTNNSDKPSDDKETAYDKTSNTGAVFASNNDEGKNKKLRGFFRKATRIFEKRTNISAADDDDKVLIGVLAVRLK